LEICPRIILYYYYQYPPLYSTCSRIFLRGGPREEFQYNSWAARTLYLGFLVIPLQILRRILKKDLRRELRKVLL